jgi:WD repeat-containing protein 42A
MSVSPKDLLRLEIDKLLEGHLGCVNTVHFDPTGQLLLSGSDDLQIMVWDWAAGDDPNILSVVYVILNLRQCHAL